MSYGDTILMTEPWTPAVLWLEHVLKDAGTVDSSIQIQVRDKRFEISVKQKTSALSNGCPDSSH
jgi:hypothetical protein